MKMSWMNHQMGKRMDTKESNIIEAACFSFLWLFNDKWVVQTKQAPSIGTFVVAIIPVSPSWQAVVASTGLVSLISAPASVFILKPPLLRPAPLLGVRVLNLFCVPNLLLSLFPLFPFINLYIYLLFPSSSFFFKKKSRKQQSRMHLWIWCTCYLSYVP